MSVYTFDVKRLNTYNYCPGRYRLERTGRNRPPTKHDIQERFFAILFRHRNNKKKLEEAFCEFHDKYASFLYDDKEHFYSSAMLAYNTKIFDKLMLDLDVETMDGPKVFKFSLREYIDVTIKVNMTYFRKLNKKSWANRIVGTLILVPEEEWNEIDLSNRFENAIISRYMTPQLIPKNGSHCTQEITYFCLPKGKIFTINQKNMHKKTISDENRMVDVAEKIIKKEFIIRPYGRLCSNCPVIDGCNPHRYGSARKRLMEELELSFT